MKAGRFVALIGILFPILGFAQDLTLKLHQLSNASPLDEDRIARAKKLMVEVVNDPKFRTKILSMTYPDRGEQVPGFTQTGHSRELVLSTILAGKENYPGTAGVIDLHLNIYYEASDTVGYTNPWEAIIHLNRYFHQDYTAAESAGNLFHEWLHKIGYTHSRRYNRYRPHSVPYKLGYLVAEMAAVLEGTNPAAFRERFMRNFDDCAEASQTE